MRHGTFSNPVYLNEPFELFENVRFALLQPLHGEIEVDVVTVRQLCVARRQTEFVALGGIEKQQSLGRK